jgi:hypothetical protein
VQVLKPRVLGADRDGIGVAGHRYAHRRGRTLFRHIRPREIGGEEIGQRRRVRIGGPGTGATIGAAFMGEVKAAQFG